MLHVPFLPPPPVPSVFQIFALLKFLLRMFILFIFSYTPLIFPPSLLAGVPSVFFLKLQSSVVRQFPPGPKPTGVSVTSVDDLKETRTFCGLKWSRATGVFPEAGETVRVETLPNVLWGSEHPRSMKKAERNNGPGVNEALDFHPVS